MLLSLFFVASREFNFDDLQRTITPTALPEDTPKRKTKSSQRENIRIILDYDYLEGNDSMKCSYEGQTIKWNYITFTCSKEDIIDETKLSILKETFENTKNYLSKLLKVTYYNTEFDLVNNYLQFANITIKTAKNCDLYITPVLRPFGSESTIASAIYTQYYANCKRPIQGLIMVNAKFIPEEAQSESSWNSSYFYTLLHEITHILGFVESNYKNFHRPDDNTPYQTPTCELTDFYGKYHTYLITKYSHQYAMIHFGVDTFYGEYTKCDSGIELEDGGSSGTPMNHLEGRLFMTDYMVGVSLKYEGPFKRFTDATAAVLLDTGNYDLNYSMIRPIIWGNGESINDSVIKGFAEQPPLTVFPSLYYSESKTDSNHCGFDYKFIGEASFSSAYNCTETDINNALYCRASSFYNPHNSKYIGTSSVFDFVPYKSPSVACEKYYAALPGNGPCIRYYLSDRDAKFTAPGGKNLDINFTCSKENEGYLNSYRYATETSIIKYDYYCPDFERFRRSMILYESYFKTSPFSNIGDKYYTPKGSLSYESNDEPTIIIPTYKTPTTKTSTSHAKLDDGYLGTGVSKLYTIILIAAVLCGAFLIVTLVALVNKCTKSDIDYLHEDPSYEESYDE